MGTYKEIRGTHIVSVTSDPPSPVNGQMWYNSTTRTLKGSKANPVGSWSTGTSMNQARWLGGSGGTETAALAFGGEDPGNSATANTESWNGSTWTEVNNLNVAQYGQANNMGTNTSSLATGGAPTATTNESWNGSSWTELGDLNTGRRYLGGAAADNTAALAFGGVGTTNQAETESWNGSAWTEVADLNTGRRNVAGAGDTYTAALAISGKVPPNAKTEVESWNGSAWTEVGDVNTARDFGGTAGSSTKALFYGGNADPPFRADTESWNGSSWTEIADMSTARGSVYGAGTLNTNALASGGYNGTRLSSVEEFVSPLNTTVTFTTS